MHYIVDFVKLVLIFLFVAILLLLESLFFLRRKRHADVFYLLLMTENKKAERQGRGEVGQKEGANVAKY